MYGKQTLSLKLIFVSSPFVIKQYENSLQFLTLWCQILVKIYPLQSNFVIAIHITNFFFVFI